MTFPISFMPTEVTSLTKKKLLDKFDHQVKVPKYLFFRNKIRPLQARHAYFRQVPMQVQSQLLYLLPQTCQVSCFVKTKAKFLSICSEVYIMKTTSREGNQTKSVYYDPKKCMHCTMKKLLISQQRKRKKNECTELLSTIDNKLLKIDKKIHNYSNFGGGGPEKLG